jgi:hypothetical protein
MTTLDPQSQLALAVQRYAVITNDWALAAEAPGLIAALQSAVQGSLTTDDTPEVAFPAAVLIPEMGQKALFVAIPDRYLVIWQKGTFKKVMRSVSIRKAEVDRVAAGRLADGALRGRPVIDLEVGAIVRVRVVLSETAWIAIDPLLEAM